MPQISANNIKLEYEEFGPRSGEPVLLIMGLGAQLTRWPLGLIGLLTAKGYRVIRYDNRDVGLSHRFHAHGPANIAQIMTDRMTGKTPSAAYLVNDMADDAAGLLDALGIDRAHIVGASMGGMIAQMVAANHPKRVLSLTSIMSATGNPATPPAKPEAMAVLTNRPDSTAIEDIVANGIKAQRTIGSPAYPAPEAEMRERIIADFTRAFYPEGFTRQMAAIVASGDRREAVRKIAAPTLVIHGADDPLVPVEGGRDTAENINGAELMIIPGMGHDLPAQLHATVADAIDKVAKRARVTA
jgi:pimeloyl-ACP methyl ester carboxylesterase